MLTKAWTQLRFHPLQSKVWRTNVRFVNLPCGRGSGKSDLSRRRVVRMLPVRKPWDNPMYFYSLPTYNQARRVAWEPILDLIPKHWIDRVSEATMVIRTVFGSKLYVVGMDRPARIEGVQWDGGVLDESCDQKPGIFDRSIMPTLSHRMGWCWRIGVPKRYGVGASEFKNICDIGTSGNDPDVVTYSWPSKDILTHEQIDAAQRLLDPRDYNEQYNASWETVGGSIFHSFSMSNVSHNATYDPSLPIVVGSDFNVDPMCWTIGHRDKNSMTIFDELFIRNTNTENTLNMLAHKYGDHQSGWEFFGDATARSRSTSASVTDYLIIKNDARFLGKRIFYLKSNPPRADRFATTNALLQNARGERRLLIHGRCKHLIDDLKLRTYREGTREPDDYGDIGHMSDGLGYIIHRCYPIKVQAGSPSPEIILV